MALTEQKPPADLSALRIHREPEKSGRPWGWLLVSAVLAVAIGTGAYLWFRGVVAVKSVETVAAALVTEGQASTILSATGYIEADTKADLSPKIVSKVTALYVTEGDRVKKDQVLARLDKTDLDAQLADARATWGNAEAEKKRQEALFRAGLGSQSALDAAVASEASWRAKVQYTEAQEDYAVIRAPFSGVVIAKRAHVGEAVSPYGTPGQATSNGAVVTLVDFSSLYVGADVNESNLSKISARQPAEIVLDAYPDHPYRGHLLEIIPTADRSKGTVKVKVAFEKLDERILPDMSARVNFTEKATTDTKSKTHVLVPKAAVLTLPSGPSVVLISDGRAVFRKVQAGPENQGEVEILSGLAGGETLAADPAKAKLSDGEKIKVKQE